MSNRYSRLLSPDLTVLALLLAACSFVTASALAEGLPSAASWALVVAAGGCGATAHRLAHRPVPDRERAGFAFGLAAALSGVVLFGTPTDPVRAGVAVRTVASLSMGALVVATVATVTYLVGVLRRRESPEQRADRILEQVIGGERL